MCCDDSKIFRAADVAAASLETDPVFRWVNRHGQLQDGRLSDRAVAKVVKRTA